jgi:transposase-like protein
MNPQTAFCPNLDCLASGHVGKGNIGIHSHKERRYICHVCGKTFAATQGTVFYRLQTGQDVVTTVIALLAHGCPLPAIVAVFQLDERTVADWQRRAGHHCEQVHEHLVQQPRDLGQVQADELRVKMQTVVVWLAMALQVSTRLWLGATVGEHRDESLLIALMQRVRACALCRPVLFCVDGFVAYLGAIHTVFREAIPTGQLGRPHLRPWDGILIAQVVKQYAHGHVVDVLRRIVQGTAAQVNALVQATQGKGVINTAYIERINATFRARLAGLVRRGRCLLHQTPILQAGVYLVGTVYNFCTNHDSLRVPLYLGQAGRRHWVLRTPAMAAGITDHCWTVYELLSYHVPPARWTPPKRRGRPSKLTQELVRQWCQ